jgi:alpha-methylacyl-CoA racemase
MTGPLNSFRVIELAGIGPAPFAGALLADLGADVVRIDRTSVSRGVGELPLRFDFYNRNKRSVALDLKRPDAVRAVLQMVAHADVLIEGFRPGVTERLGLGPVPCFDANPRLVYGRMTGWGQDGPFAQVVGHDINYLALTGALHSIGVAEQPVPPLNLVADLGGGAMYLAVGVLAAAMESRRSGRGQVVDVAMIDGVANLMSAFQAFRQAGTWHVARGANFLDGGAHFYCTYATSDGKFVAVGALEPQFYTVLLDVLGLSSERLPEQYDRTSWAGMRERFAAIFRTRSRDEWVQLMAGRDACFTPVLDLDEAPEHPQMRARGVFTQYDEARYPSPAPRFERTPGTLRRPPPEPGQHSREVLADWGLTDTQIDDLQAAGTMQQAGTE